MELKLSNMNVKPIRCFQNTHSQSFRGNESSTNLNLQSSELLSDSFFLRNMHNDMP